MSSTKEAGDRSHSHSHGHAHHGSSQEPSAMVERLLELRNSDPELFSQAWRKIPPTTQENIMAYLKKHGVEDQPISRPHANFEDKDPDLHKRKGSTQHSTESARVDHKEHDNKNLAPPAELLETHRNVQALGRPLFEWTDGELLARTILESESKDTASGREKDDAHIATELRKISRQSTVQIVQNELIRRLLQTIAGKS
jgi:hypothetical protein